jgi:hypothetical protein
MLNAESSGAFRAEYVSIIKTIEANVVYWIAVWGNAGEHLTVKSHARLWIVMISTQHSFMYMGHSLFVALPSKTETHN